MVILRVYVKSSAGGVLPIYIRPLDKGETGFWPIRQGGYKKIRTSHPGADV
jgi:hypothetical protein